ncbi:hypothetical protein BDV35DRAFT_383150 [Aspergillus flavus]|uniref:Uncharacterized protein n=1 Tax=Aspergillus flavus TaxID=5059 RepID=A0A5N6GQV3_ASPFL|nr:hypothetical protein BDV35DRAFT_383150 [Aspergillus flavus]
MDESPEVSCVSSIQPPSVTSEDAAPKVVCFHIRGAGCSHVPIMGVSLSKPLTNILATIGVSKRSHEHGPLRRRQSRRRPKEEDGLDPWVSYDRPPLEPPKNVNVSARYRRSTPALIGNKTAGGTSRSFLFRVSFLVG